MKKIIAGLVIGTMMAFVSTAEAADGNMLRITCDLVDTDTNVVEAGVFKIYTTNETVRTEAAADTLGESTNSLNNVLSRLKIRLSELVDTYERQVVKETNKAEERAELDAIVPISAD
jgi:hypothetical protein